MANIKDIAREAGVGVGTVSRYANGYALKPSTADKVRAAIGKLGFTLNTVARGLKTNRTRTIGVVIPDFADIYGGTMIKYLERGLSAHGYGILACDSSACAGREAEKVRQLLQRRVDGLILYPCSSDIGYLRDFPELAVDADGSPSSTVPVITVDMLTEGYPCDQILTDNHDATLEATRWLIRRGHRRIGLISGPCGYFTASERRSGYLGALREAGLEEDSSLVAMTEHFDEAGGRDALERFLNLPEPPSAVITCNYYTTLGAVQTVYQYNLEVPERLALIGFDNLGLSAMVRPPLSIIVQPMEEIGAAAAELLIRRLQGDREGFPSLVRYKTTLLLRGST
jgi:LacI family transcriptional regulator